MRLLLATDGPEQSEAAVDQITHGHLRDLSVVEQLSSPEMFSHENLYRSHCGDREIYTRAGACGGLKSGSTANVAAANPILQSDGNSIAAAFPELVTTLRR